MEYAKLIRATKREPLISANIGMLLLAMLVAICVTSCKVKRHTETMETRTEGRADSLKMVHLATSEELITIGLHALDLSKVRITDYDSSGRVVCLTEIERNISSQTTAGSRASAKEIDSLASVSESHLVAQSKTEERKTTKAQPLLPW